MRLGGWIVAAALVMAAGLGSAEAPPAKLALVIGNGDYQVADWKLGNPPRDARAVAARLRGLGFEVDERVDASRQQMLDAFRQLGETQRRRGEDAVAVVYYAGHGAQQGGANFLVPVDADASTAAELSAQAPQLDDLLARLNTSEKAVNLVILDACRNMPLPGEPNGRLDDGLADEGRRASLFIAYATSPGAVAADGQGDHSPFTAALLDSFDRQSRDPVALLFDDLKARVYATTGKAQKPEYVNGLVQSRWSFVAAPAGPTAPPRPTFVRTPDFLKTLDRAKLMDLTNANTTFVDTLLSRRDLLASSDIDTPLRLAHFLGQVGYETGNFRSSMDESLNYSGEKLWLVFARYFRDEAEARSFDRQPEKIANRIYANKGGNGDEASGDGWRYRGRGFFMFTFKDNYNKIGQQIGVDLVAEPYLMSDPEVALAAAAAFWKSRGLNERADADDLSGVTRGINGAMRSGLERRGALVAKAKAALGIAPAPAP